MRKKQFMSRNKPSSTYKPMPIYKSMPSNKLMKRLAITSLLVMAATNSIAEEIPFVSLPEKYTFETEIKSVCANRSGLRICREPTAPVTYCNSNRFDCSKLENHNTLKQFIAMERNIDINCIAAINHQVQITNGRKTTYVTFDLVKSDDCNVRL